MSTQLWQHQVEAIQFAQRQRDFGMFMDPGTGKTRTMIEILRRLYASHGKLRKTLIFCPIIVCENWRQEFQKFSKINPQDIVVLTKSGKKREETLLKELGPGLTKAKIVVTNYEAVEMDLYHHLLKWNPEILICDESQRLKNPESVRAKKIAALADKTQHNYILTGTPILNSPMDVFMQFKILDRGETFGKNFFAFRSAYFIDRNSGFKGRQNYFPKWEISPKAEPMLQAKIKQKAMRVLKNECLTLPPFVRQEIPTELSPEQARAYKQMYNDFITFIEKEGEDKPAAVVAQLAVTKALRLQQIVTGFVKDEEGNIHRLKCPRLDVLKELLTDLVPGHKVIVWAEFKENYKMIAEVCEKLKIQYREIHGDIPQKDREGAMEDFRKDPDVRVMIANQGAAGIGVNLVEASYSIYYSKGFKLENDLQSEARNYRGGSEMHDKITRIDIVAKGTIDELVTKALLDKQNLSERILTWKDQLRLNV